MYKFEVLATVKIWNFKFSFDVYLNFKVIQGGSTVKVLSFVGY